MTFSILIRSSSSFNFSSERYASLSAASSSFAYCSFFVRDFVDFLAVPMLFVSFRPVEFPEAILGDDDASGCPSAALRRGERTFEDTFFTSRPEFERSSLFSPLTSR